jgi:hypothetical protein
MAARRKRSKPRVPAELFLSHSHHDRAFTRKIAADLRRHGIRIWFSERNIRGAHRWLTEIGAALERCDWMIVILTPDAVRSHWVSEEVGFALGEKRYRGRVIPLVLKKCEPKKVAWPLANIQNVPARPYKDALRQLLAIWGVTYRDA